VEPGPTGSSAWDAALAAVSDYRLNTSNLPSADWILASARTLAVGAAPHLSEYGLEPNIDDIPLKFRRRNVLTERSSLQSA
jgi:hypothetical protein